MALDRIAGRDREKKYLKGVLKSPKAEFIAVYGRRRIGKTFLIREFFGNRISFELTGVYGASMQDQLINFKNALTEAYNIQVPIQAPGRWQEAFNFLRSFIEKDRSRKKKVIFIDELPWLSTPRSGFLNSLEHFWNSFASRHNDIILIVCGSAASWMIQHIVDSKGGLHNRLTGKIKLQAFTLAESKEYLSLRKIRNLDHYQLVQLYMAFGGVPYYWSHIRSGLSAAQVIDDLLFSRGAILEGEYDNLFASLFNSSTYHNRIVNALKHRTRTRKELLKYADLPSGGTATNIIRELEESGFIRSYVPYGKKSNSALYRISDEYILFYLHWIEPRGRKSLDKLSWLNVQGGQKFTSWSGYSYEGICFKHIEEIKYYLRLDQIISSCAPWSHRPNKEDSTEGAQIDLLIDRHDMVINLCEIKFYRSKLTIDSRMAKELRRKADVFRIVEKPRKSIFFTIISTFGLNANTHSASLNAIDVPMEALFQQPGT